MQAAPRCADCRHHSGPPVGPEQLRECRASPPTLAHEVHVAGRVLFAGSWPLTRPSDGCGSWCPYPVMMPELTPGPEEGTAQESAPEDGPEEEDAGEEGPPGDEPGVTTGEDPAPAGPRRKRRKRGR